MRPRIAAAWAAVTGTGAAASLALAMLALICTFVAVAVPRASLGYRTAVLQRSFRAAPSSATTVLADADISGPTSRSPSAGLLDAGRAQLAGDLRRDGLPLAPPAADWSGMVTGSSPFSVAGRPRTRTLAPPQLELLYRSGLRRNARLAAGSLPAAVTPGGTAAGGTAAVTVQVAVTQATAARFGLHPGSRLRAAGHEILVTGILRPRRPASSFWAVDPVAASPELTYPTPDAAPYLSSGAFVSAAELPALQGYLSGAPLRALWSFPLDLSRVTADQAGGLARALRAIAYLPAATSVSTSLSASEGLAATIQISLSSGLATTLPSFVATDDAVQRVLSLMFVSLAVIAAVVVLLGARLVAARRRGEFTMMRARGAALRQVAAVALAGGAVTALPAAALGVGAAVAVTPGPVSQLAWWLAGLIVAASLAGLPLLAAWQQRTPRRATGSAPAARRRAAAARRWVAATALVLGSAGGLILLRRQGLPPPGQVDLFTSAAPVLVAIPVALLVMRAYPVVLRQLARLARGRRGVVLVIGFARGEAAAQAGVLPAFALVLAFAVIAFAGTARGAVARANVTASWRAVGADAVVTAPEVGPGITPAAQRLITRVPGVRRSATVTVAQGTSGQGLQLPVIILDPGQYARLAATVPGPARARRHRVRQPRAPRSRPRRWPGRPRQARCRCSSRRPPGPSSARTAGCT